MIGARRVVDRITATLQAALPGQLAAIRAEQELVPAQLVEPVSWWRQERPQASLNETPAVMVAVQRMVAFERADHTRDGSAWASSIVTGGIYRATYDVAVTVAVHALANAGNQWDDVADRRDNYLAALLSSLLAHPGLTDPEERCAIVPGSITSNLYASPDPSRTRSYREGDLRFRVQHIEPESIAPLGVVAAVTVIDEVVTVSEPLA